MSKKQDGFYFQNFMDCAECSRKAVYFLKETLEHFDASALKEKLNAMHEIEHDGDSKKHELMNTLVKAFITPIDREDLMQISQNMDDLTDKIEDVLIRIYYNHISDIRDR